MIHRNDPNNHSVSFVSAYGIVFSQVILQSYSHHCYRDILWNGNVRYALLCRGKALRACLSLLSITGSGSYRRPYAVGVAGTLGAV